MTPPGPLSETETDLPEPPSLRFLRVLVTVLTAVMIVGVALIVVLMAMTYNKGTTPLPEQITLPSGATASTFTQGDDWYAVVTTDDQILIYDRATNALRQTIRIDRN